MRPNVARPAANALPTEIAQCLRSIVHSNVRVLHRCADIGMTRKFASFGQRRPASQKLSYMRVPASSVEIGDAFLGFVRNTNPLQVFPDHEPCSSPLQVLEEQSIRSDPVDPLSHHCDQFGMKRQNILLAMLRDGCLDRDGGRVSIKVEALGGQAGDLLSPQAGHEGDHVDACSDLAGELLDGFLAILG